MNDKLKQSLDTRLGGMRWGGREQAEVFRQIRHKETQDMKHIKRGSGLLAVAIAMLFIVMGAAFALTSPTAHPDETRSAAQTAEPVFVPVAIAACENDYFTLAIDAADFDGTALSFTATLRMKDPGTYMFLFAGHTPPGDPARLPVRITTRATAEAIAPDMKLVSGGDLSGVPDVLSMTEDSATFRITGTPGATGPDMRVTLEVTWTDPHTGNVHTDVLAWTMAATEQPVVTLLENEYITATLTERRMESGQSIVAIDVIPAKPWYVLNRPEEGKATLQVHVDRMWVYPCNNHDELMMRVETREEPLCTPEGTMEQTPTGLRWTLREELPTGYDTLLGYLCVSVSAEAEELHSASGLPHYAEMIVPLPVPATVPAPSPVPAATAPAPAPQRPEPTGTYLCGTEHFRVYLEESWHDGFSAEATLRVRANDPAYFLDVTPNKLFWPDGDVWIVGLKGGRNDDYSTSVIPAKGRDTTTGDVIVQLTYQNLYGDISQFTTPLTLTMTHEKTQARESTEIVLWPEPAEYPRQPLQLIGGSDTDAFLRAVTVTTDRYHYVGVMSTRDNTYSGLTLADAYGSILASSYRPIHIVSTAEDSKLFPAAGEGYANLSIVRLDKTTPLPDVLNVHFQSGDRQDLPHFMLGSGSPDAQTIIHENEYVLITLHSDWYDGRSAILTLQATLKDPEAYAFVESADSTPPDGKLGVALTSMVGWSNESFSRHGWMTLSRPWALDDSILWQAKAFDIDPDVDELLIGGYLWLTTPSGEETIAINHAIPQTGLWQEYTLTPIAPTETIRLERATLHGGTHASYYDLTYVPQDSAGPLTLRIASVNDAPLSIYAAQTGDADGFLCTSIVAQTRLEEQTAVIEVCTADGQVLEKIVCQIEKAIIP